MQITDQNGDVWEVEDLKLYFDAEGYIQYGYQPNGFFVISGQDGPEAKGWPGVTLTKHPKVLRTKDHRMRLINQEEFERLSGTREFTPQPPMPGSETPHRALPTTSEKVSEVPFPHLGPSRSQTEQEKDKEKDKGTKK